MLAVVRQLQWLSLSLLHPMNMSGGIREYQLQKKQETGVKRICAHEHVNR